MTLPLADYLIQSGLAKQIRFHGKRFAWFVSDVTRKDWNWLLNTMVYGELFKDCTEAERESLRKMGLRWKQYEKEGKWVYEQHPFWCTGKIRNDHEMNTTVTTARQATPSGIL